MVDHINPAPRLTFHTLIYGMLCYATVKKAAIFSRELPRALGGWLPRSPS